MSNHSSESCQQSESWPPEYIVIGPGSVKGICVVGLLHELEVNGYLDNIKGYAGSSVGSIISLLLTIGLPVSRVASISCSVNLFKGLMTNYDINSIQSMFEEMKNNFGLISPWIIGKQLEWIVEKKFGFVPTMSELYKITGKHFVCTTYNETEDESVYIDHITHPDLLCTTAVVFSCAIPIFMFEIKSDGCTYMDGGLVDPMPIYKFDNGENKILGIYVDTSSSNRSNGQEIFGFMSHFAKIQTCTSRKFRDYIIEKSSDCCTFVSISTDVVDITGVTVSIEDKMEMITRGMLAGKKLLSRMTDKNIVETTSNSEYETESEIDNSSSESREISKID